MCTAWAYPGPGRPPEEPRSAPQGTVGCPRARLAEGPGFAYHVGKEGTMNIAITGAAQAVVHNLLERSWSLDEGIYFDWKGKEMNW